MLAIIGRQENGTDGEKLRRWQNTTNSSAVAFLVRKGPLRFRFTITLQSEIIAKLIPKTLFHVTDVTEMRFSRK